MGTSLDPADIPYVKMGLILTGVFRASEDYGKF